MNDMNELNAIEKYRENYIIKSKIGKFLSEEYKTSSEVLILRYQTFLSKDTFPWETRGAPFLV